MSWKMPFKSTLLVLFLLAGFQAGAQDYPLRGKVLTLQGAVIPFATLQLKGQNKGTITLDDGSYELLLPAGAYQLVVSRLGFRTVEQAVTVTDSLRLDMILEEEATSLAEVVVRARLRDRAEEIMRQVIR